MALYIISCPRYPIQSSEAESLKQLEAMWTVCMNAIVTAKVKVSLTPKYYHSIFINKTQTAD